MSNKNQFTGRDAFYRMKYLHQIADMCRQKPGDDYTKLMLYYGSQLVSIGKKTQSRMSPEMKRTICKVCNAILVPGDTEKIRLVRTKRQPDKMKSICVLCGTEKVFNLRKDYKLWCEKPESIVKIIDTRENEQQNRKFKNKFDSNGGNSKTELKFDKCINDLKNILNSKKNTSDEKDCSSFNDLNNIVNSDKNKAFGTKLIPDNKNGDPKDNVTCKNDSSNTKLTTDEDLKNIVDSDEKKTLDLNLTKDSTISEMKDLVNSKKNTSGENLSKTCADSELMEIDETPDGV